MTAPAISRQFQDIPPAEVVDALNTFIREANQWFDFIRVQITVPASGVQEFVEISPANVTDALNALVTDLDTRFEEIYAAMGVDYEHMTPFAFVPMDTITSSVNQIIVEANQRYGFMYGALPYLAAVVSAMPSAMTAAHKGALLGLFSAFQTADVLGSTDIFFDVFGAENEANAEINLVDPSGTAASFAGTVAQAQGYGAKGDGSTGYINTNWVPGADGVNFQTTAGAILTSEASNIASATSPSASVIAGSAELSLIPRTGGGQYLAAINVVGTGGTNGGTASTSVGHTMAIRSGSTITVYKNGVATDWSFTAGSTAAVLARALYWLARNNGGVADRFSSRYARFLMAGNYNAAQAAVISDALDDYVSTLEAPYIYASSVSYGGIPIGDDTSGLGSPGAPFLTVDTANTSSSPTQILKLNGNPAAPTTYTHASRLSLAGAGIDSVEALGATLRATATAEVLYVPASASIGALTIDGQNANQQCVEVPAGSAAFTVSLTGTVLTGATLYGAWTSGVASYCTMRFEDVTVSLGNARGCINWLGRSGASLQVVGGTFTITNAILSGQGGIVAITAAPNCTASITGSTVDVTIDAALSGTSVTGIRLDNIATAVVDGVTLSVDGVAADKVIYGITLSPTRDANVQDMGGFRITDTTIDIRTFPGTSAVAIWVGYDGTTDTDVANGKLNGGVIENVTVTGADADTQLGGMHGIGIASHADTQVTNCTVNRAGIHYVIKESSPVVEGCMSTGAASTHYLFKGSRAGATVRNCVAVANADGSGTLVDGHVNDGTGNNCQLGYVQDCNFVNDGGTGVIFVDVGVDQNIQLSGNNYYNKSGTLNAFPWRYHGVQYATFEEWKAAVEPDATNYDLGV